MTIDAVFLDTVGLIALWDESDQWHDGAEAAFQLLKSAACRLIYAGSAALKLRRAIHSVCMRCGT